MQPPLTPVTLQQNAPVSVEIWKSIPDTIKATLVGIVLFTHWVSCIVFLVTMYSIYDALQQMQENFDKLGF